MSPHHPVISSAVQSKTEVIEILDYEKVSHVTSLMQLLTA